MEESHGLAWAYADHPKMEESGIVFKRHIGVYIVDIISRVLE